MVTDARSIKLPLTPLLEGIEKDDLAPLLAEATRLELEADQTVSSEGARADAFFVMVAGAVEVTHRDAFGDQHLLAELGPGAVLCETAIFLDKQEATISTIAPSTLLRLPIEGFKDLVSAGNPAAVQVLFNIARSLAVRLQAADKRLGQPRVSNLGAKSHIIRSRASSRQTYLNR